jgi:hypothetical protein
LVGVADSAAESSSIVTPDVLAWGQAEVAENPNDSGVSVVGAPRAQRRFNARCDVEAKPRNFLGVGRHGKGSEGKDPKCR